MLIGWWHKEVWGSSGAYPDFLLTLDNGLMDESQGCHRGCPFLLLDKSSLGYLKIHYTMCKLEHILMDGYTESWFHSLLGHWDCDWLGCLWPWANCPPQNCGDNGNSQAHWSIVRMDCFSRPIKFSEFRWERPDYYQPFESSPSFVTKVKLYFISLATHYYWSPTENLQDFTCKLAWV